MNSLFMDKYKPAIILTLALTVFLASCKPSTKSWVVSTLAGIVENPPGKDDTSGFANGPGTAAQFNYPTGVAVDSSGNVYVADYNNYCIRKITSEGVVSTLAGSGSAGDDDATGTEAQFDHPIGVAVDSSGDVYVADTANHLIRKITSAGVVSTFAGSTEGYKDATGTAAQFNRPTGVAVDSSGNLYVTDYSNHRIRKITSEGVVSTLAGSGTPGYKDAIGTAAQFYLPSGVAVDSSGNVYVTDLKNHRIREITSTGVVTTLAGSGTAGDDDATDTEAQFDGPSGVAVDSSGILYVADSDNHRIRKIEYK